MDITIYLIAHVIVTLGIYNIVETFFIKNRETNKLKYIMYSLYYIITSFGMIFLENPNLNIMINVVSLFLLTQIYIGTQGKKILVALIVYASTMVVDGSVYNILMAMNIFEVGIGISSIITSLGIYIYSLMIKHLLREYLNLGKENYSQYILMLIIPLFCIGILTITLSEKYSYTGISYISLALLIINITSYITLHNITQLQNKTHKAEVIALQNESEQIQIEATKKLELEIRSLRHDIRNHIYIINEMVKSREYHQLKEYTDELVEKVEEKALFVNTGRFDIDSIVNAKLTKAKNIGASIEVDTFACDKIKINRFDLITILSNLLDNSVEALEKVDNKELKFVMKYNLGTLRIKVENTVKEKVNTVNGKIKTTKHDKNKHGYGMENIINVVHKYNGFIEYSNKNNRFIMEITLFP